MKALLWLVFVLLIASTVLGEGVSDPDLWWHIAVGRWILAEGQVPHTELWNTFALGKPWYAYSWAPEVIFAATEASRGIAGLLLLKGGLSFLLVALCAISLSSISRNWILGTALAAVATLACQNYFGLRPQVLSWICFALSLAIADRLSTSGNKKLLLLNILVFTAWANSHLTAVFGILAGLIWCWGKTKHKVLSTCLLFVGSAFLGTLFTPYFGGEWITMLSKTGHPLSHIYISEFQPTNLYNAGAGLTLILAVLLGLFAHYSGKSISVIHLISAAGLVLLGFTIQKFLPFAALFCASSVASIWQDSQSRDVSLGHLGEGITRGTNKIESVSPLGIAGLLLLCLLGSAKNIAALDSSGLDFKRTPIRAVDFMLENNTPLPLMNTFDDGGYLLYRYNTSKQDTIVTVPIDGRTNINDPDIVSLFLSALRGAGNWRDYIEKTKPGSILWKSGTALSSLLLLDADWCQVYPERGAGADQWSVFVRKEFLQAHPSEFSSVDCAPPVPEEKAAEQKNTTGENE